MWTLGYLWHLRDEKLPFHKISCTMKTPDQINLFLLMTCSFILVFVQIWTFFFTNPRLNWGRMTLSSLRPRPNRRHFADDIFKCIFENENEWISPRISLKFVLKVRINNIPSLFIYLLGAVQATSHYLNQWWLVYWRIYASLGLNELNIYPCVVFQKDEAFKSNIFYWNQYFLSTCLWLIVA